jgi:hypothetical protein
MGKYKFLLPDGRVAQVEAESFVKGLMRVCTKIGLRPLTAAERGTRAQGVRKLIRTKRIKEDT